MKVGSSSVHVRTQDWGPIGTFDLVVDRGPGFVPTSVNLRPSTGPFIEYEC